MLLIISNATIPDDDEVTHVGTENWTGDLYGALIATKGAIIGSSNKEMPNFTLSSTYWYACIP